MRKIFIILLALLLSQGALMAQDTGEDLWRPDPGNFMIEITGSPFDGSSLLNFGQLRAKYQLTDILVPRLGFSMSINNDQSTPDVVTNVSGFTVMPGIEYHLTNEGKFSSYAAFDVVIGHEAQSRKSTTGSTVLGSTSLPSSSSSSVSKGFFEIGGQLSAGADYYFNSRFYIGVEIGIQLVKRNENEIFIDGELFQESTTVKYGSVNRSNSFRVGFLLK